MVLKMDLSTSPGVECGVAKLPLADGDHILLEDKPELVSHVAIVPDGVWDKGGPPTGIAKSAEPEIAEPERKSDSVSDAASADQTSTSSGDTEMADKAEEMKKADAAEKMSDSDKLDAIGEHLKKIHDSVNELHAKHEEHEKRLSAIEGDGGADRKDATGEGEHDDPRDVDESSKEALKKEREENNLKENDGKKKDAACEDGKKMDAEEEEEKEDKRDSRRRDARRRDAEEDKRDAKRRDSEEDKKEDSMRKHDAATERTIAELQSQIAALSKRIPTQMSDADRAQFVSAQEKAERVFQLFGDAAPRSMDGETLLQYRVRLANKVKTHSGAWKDIDLSGLNDAALSVAESTIYKDSTEAAMHPIQGGGESLREIVEKGYGGRETHRFVGSDTACWAPFQFPRMRGRINRMVGKQ
jgi:hypothetical protein